MIFTLLLAAAVAVIVATFRLGAHSAWGVYARSALCPAYFIGVLHCVFVIDYLYLYQDVYIGVYETNIYVSKNDIEDSFAYYVFCLFASLSAVALACGTHRKTSDSAIDRAGARLAWRTVSVIWLGAAIFAAVTLYGSLTDVVGGKISRQVLFREDPVLLIIFAGIPAVVALALNAARKMSLGRAMVVAVLASSTLLTGSRGALILLSITIACYLHARVRRLPSLLLLVAIPLGAAYLLYTRFIFREAWRHETIGDFLFAKGGLREAFFGTAEVSMAEVITTCLKIGADLGRSPLDTVLAPLMFPLPRSVFTFKPLGTDAFVTEILSPLRWITSKSEVTVTGFGEALISFGPILGVVFVFFVTFLIARFAAFSSNTRHSVLFLPFALWWYYLFARSGLYNMASSIWATTFVLLIAVLVGTFSWSRRA